MKKVFLIAFAIALFATVTKAQTNFRGITYKTNLVVIGDSVFLDMKKNFALYVDSIPAATSTHAITDTTKFYLPASPDSGTTFLFNASVGDSTPILIYPNTGQKINGAAANKRQYSWVPTWLTWVGGWAGWLSY